MAGLGRRTGHLRLVVGEERGGQLWVGVVRHMGGQAGGDVWVRAGGDLVCTAVEVLGCWVPLWDSEEGRVIDGAGR